jgi:hypothetical protein
MKSSIAKPGTACFIAIALLATTVLYFAVAWFDSTTELSDARQEQKYEKDRENILKTLLLIAGNRLTRQELCRLVRTNLGTGHVIREDSDTLTVDGVILKFNGNTLTDVSNL